MAAAEDVARMSAPRIGWAMAARKLPPATGARRGPRGLSLTLDERVARGKLARADVPRSSHGAWSPAADRPDPVALLEEQAESRVPELVPVRHGRMLVSPFTFFRGAALIMAADLAETPNAGVAVQLCGDAHLSNFGVFASPERRLVFDINDFDETFPGPWEWDVKRLAASFEVAGRDLGFVPADRREVVLTAVRTYRLVMLRAATMRVIDAWYDHLDVDEISRFVKRAVRDGRLGKAEAKEAAADIAKARTRDHLRAFAKRTDEVGGELRFVADPPLIVPMDDLAPVGADRDLLETWIHDNVKAYRRSLAREHHPIEEYRLIDTARKVVGVGSVGTRAWIHLFVGRDDSDPLILQSKEAQPSVLERFLGKSPYSNNGQRVVVGQHLMQAATDIFLGWYRAKGVDGVTRDYYARQLHDWKGGAEVETFRVPGAALYAELCGATLARAHARWGDRIAIASYLGKGDAFDRAIADFSAAYADQNERDYEAFSNAVKSGRISAETGL
jgi:uncharacterized protein (DUF2252 family)